MSSSKEEKDVETGVEVATESLKVENLVSTLTEDLDGDTPEAKLESFVSSRSVAILAKSSCPFCRDVIEFLSHDVGVRIYVYHVDQHGSEGASILKAAKAKTSHATVPMVFVKEEFLGGCDDVKALHAKRALEPKLADLIVTAKTVGATSLETAKLAPVSRGEARHPLFWFPNVVNNYVVRVTGFLVFVLGVLSAAFYNKLWGRYLAVGLLVDFCLRLVAGSRVSPLGMIATVVVSPFRPQFRPGPPKQFAAFCGVTFSLLGTIFFFAPSFDGHDIVAACIMGMLAGAAGLEAFLDFCLGCLFFKIGIDYNIFPDSVYRIYTSSKQEVEDTWDYANTKTDEPRPRVVAPNPSDPTALRYKPKSDEWTKDDFHLIRNMQVTYFGMPLSLVGLSAAFKIASDWGMIFSGTVGLDERTQVVPDAWYQVFAVIAAVAFVPMLVLYSVRFVLHFNKIKHEWDSPLQSPSFGLIAITLMMFAWILYDEIADDPNGSGAQWVSRVLFWMGAIMQCFLTIAKSGEWVGKRLEMEHVDTSWMILPVGLSVAALVAPIIPMFDDDQVTTVFTARFFYSFAVLMWLTLFVITFFKTTTTHNSDNRARHGVFIWVAAPCVIGLANLSICLNDSFSSDIVAFAQCEADFSHYYFIGLFIFAILAWATLPYIAFFGREKFGMAYWTECFALDTLAACAAAFYALNGYNASRTLMYTGLSLAAIANMCALLHTIAALVRRRGVFTPEVKWGPLSFMKLTHEAFRGNMETLRMCLDNLDINEKTEVGSNNMGLFAAHFNRFCMTHEEHAKHEDQVIFKVFNDYFPEHAKKFNDDHAEDHVKMEGWRKSANKLLDTSLGDAERQSAVDSLKKELPPFFDHFMEHLLGEERHLQCIARKILPLEVQKQISRECFRLTAADRWEVIIPFIVTNLPRHEQRIRYLKVLAWSLPERAQQIGAMVYRNVDAVMWERLRVEVPEMIPRRVPNWRRYY